MLACHDGTKPPPIQEIDAWVKQLMTFLDQRMGRSYAVRAMNPSGVPIGVSLNGVDQDHVNAFRVVYALNHHLEQFSEQPFLRVKV